MASDGIPDIFLLCCIVAAVLAGLSAGNVINALCDEKIDAENPRTANRPIPSGAISKKEAWVVFIICILILVAATVAINPFFVILLPIPASIFLMYSFTKRFTWLCHVVLAIAEASSPVAGWIVISGRLSIGAILLGAVVFLWSLGFELIYSTQDVEYDKRDGMNSVPVRFGVEMSLLMSSLSHVIMAVFFIAFAVFNSVSWIFYAGMVCGFFVIVAEHIIVGKNKVQNAGKAFDMNQIFSVIIMISAILNKII